MALLRLALLIGLLGAAGLVCVLVGRVAAVHVQTLMSERASAALATMRLDWPMIEIDGLVVRLRGTAPDMHAQALARETLALALPAARIEDHSAAHSQPAPRRPPVRVELYRDVGKLMLLGTLPDEAARAPLLETFRNRAPDLWIEDLTSIGAAPAPQPLAVDLAAEAVLRVPRARVILRPGLLHVTGLAATDAQRLALSRRLLAAAPGGLRLELDIRVPPPVIAPFAVSISKRGAGGLRLELCAARTAEEAAALRGLLRQAGFRDGEALCPHGGGGPPGDWLGAVAAGLGILGAVEEGRFRLHYRLARLEVPAEIPDSAAEAMLADLRSGLPPGFTARLGRRRAATARTGEPEPGPLLDYWMAYDVSADSVDLSGIVPDRAAGMALETLAAARFPNRLLRSTLATRDAPEPEGWRQAAAAALIALEDLEAGRVRLFPGRLRVEAALAAPAAAATLHRALAEAAPGYALSTAFRIDLPAQVLAVPLVAARCVAELNALMTAEPLAFAPGSAVLEPHTAPTLDRAAALLGRCAPGRLEIGGHTDSQGSEGFNQRLSQARADSVREALLARGIGPRRLVARGHGESSPIASNATEEGRARNRRIAFSSLAPEDGADSPDDETARTEE
ncbi:OmpA family protein [Paralimibaculum aggregatum]|uniref:OmpA family protein n=1 Tax=Paralimibaculum aggregatum TaxID=3036245 RepID=A0ABQ6LL07_9RHOB|nr:OmpA family protein [Limibaculum sp. NKW23]GMG82944.1 OmpA family protein [Limibaculum sp. NKW23]